jgi:hypothetical protein
MDTGVDRVLLDRDHGVAASAATAPTLPKGLPGETDAELTADSDARIATIRPEGSRRHPWLIGGSVAAVALMGCSAMALWHYAPGALPFKALAGWGASMPRSSSATIRVEAGAPGGATLTPLVSQASRLAAVAVPEGMDAPVKPAGVAQSRDAQVAEVQSFKAAEVPPSDSLGSRAGADAPPNAVSSEVTGSIDGAAAKASSAADPVLGVSPSRPAPSSTTASPPGEIGVSKSAAPAPTTPASPGPAVVAPSPTLAPMAPQVVDGAGVLPAGADAVAPSSAAAAPLPLVDAPTMAEEPAVATTESSPATAPARPRDAAEQAAVLQAAPMSDAQQLEVLGLVTELGALVRDLKAEVAALHEDQARLTTGREEELADFGRRLSLAEARWTVAGAISGANRSMAQVGAARSSVARWSNLSGESAGTSTKPAQHQYRVQAASPGLAMLAEVTSEGVEHRQVGVGDTVPGYGRISTITQRGTAWVVVTDKGTIQ